MKKKERIKELEARLLDRNSVIKSQNDRLFTLENKHYINAMNTESPEELIKKLQANCDKRDLEIEQLRSFIKTQTGESFELREYPIVAEPIEKEVLVWEDLESVGGWFVSDSSKLMPIARLRADSDQNVFKTKEQAEAVIALAKISQLLPIYNEGWTPDLEDSSMKRVITFFHGDISTMNSSSSNSYFLAFKTEEIRDKFLKHNRELIEQAKPLL